MSSANGNTIRENSDFYTSRCDKTDFLHTGDMLALCFWIKLSINFQSSVQIRNEINNSFVFIINIETNCWLIFMGDPNVGITLYYWNSRSCWYWSRCWWDCYSTYCRATCRGRGIKSWKRLTHTKLYVNIQIISNGLIKLTDASSLSRKIQASFSCTASMATKSTFVDINTCTSIGKSPSRVANTDKRTFRVVTLNNNIYSQIFIKIFSLIVPN